MQGPDESPGEEDDELDLLEMLEAEFADEGTDQAPAESPPRCVAGIQQLKLEFLLELPLAPL